MADQSAGEEQSKPHSKKLKILTTGAVYFGNIGLVNVLVAIHYDQLRSCKFIKKNFICNIKIFLSAIQGYLVNAIPPALEDIRLRYGADIDEISVVFTIQLILYCVGAITCNFTKRTATLKNSFTKFFDFFRIFKSPLYFSPSFYQ